MTTRDGEADTSLVALETSIGTVHFGIDGAESARAHVETATTTDVQLVDDVDGWIGGELTADDNTVGFAVRVIPGQVVVHLWHDDAPAHSFTVTVEEGAARTGRSHRAELAGLGIVRKDAAPYRFLTERERLEWVVGLGLG